MALFSAHNNEPQSEPAARTAVIFLECTCTPLVGDSALQRNCVVAALTGAWVPGFRRLRHDGSCAISNRVRPSAKLCCCYDFA